jgi:hypothetical protein
MEKVGTREPGKLAIFQVKYSRQARTRIVRVINKAMRRGYCRFANCFSSHMAFDRINAALHPPPRSAKPMASYELSSFNRVLKPFDPKILRRSTIAIPLREVIEQEIAQTEEFLKNHSKVLEGHNAAVFHRADFPGGLEKARAVALERLAEAIKENGETRPQRIDPYDANSGLPEEINLAQLDGRVIRTLLAIDSGENESAIRRIWPSQFEIVIDVNLNFKPRPDEVSKLVTPDYRVVAQQRCARVCFCARGRLGDQSRGCCSLNIHDP